MQQTRPQNLQVSTATQWKLSPCINNEITEKPFFFYQLKEVLQSLDTIKKNHSHLQNTPEREFFGQLQSLVLLVH